MQSEMLAILTAFFLYHGDAGWVWWSVYVLVCALYISLEIKNARKKMAQEIEDSLKYWEGK
jgi:hypothetical protein